GLEHPGRRQMCGTDQAGLVRVVADDLDLGPDFLVLQQQRGPTDGELADATAGKAAAEDETLGVSPFFQFEETLQHAGKLLRKRFDRALHDPGRLASPLASKSSSFFWQASPSLPCRTDPGRCAAAAYAIRRRIDEMRLCWRGRRQIRSHLSTRRYSSAPRR